MSQTRFQSSTNESLSTKIITEVAAAKGVSPIDVQPPLYDVIDSDALDSLFADQNGASRVGQVSFNYAGHEVTVESSGEVDVQVANKTIPQND